MFKSFFYADTKEKKIFIFYLVLLAVLAFGISLVVLLVSIPGQENTSIPAVTAETTPEPDKLHLQDFIMPDTWIPIHESAAYSFHQVLPSWGRQQIEQYWISPRKISIEILSKQNDTYIEELFANIP
jgi:hypothetical protein